jgi:hypothetical protein
MSRQGKLAALASTGVTKAELDLLDGVTSTTAELNITDGVTSTAAELNILDGVTATAAEINLIDGGTARGTTAVADGDGFLTNDGGTMRMTKVDTLATYMGTKITGGSMVYLASSGAISNAASVAFTQFDASKYDHYQFMLQNVIPATNAVLLLAQTSTNGGTAYSSTDGDYHINGTANVTGLRVAGHAAYTIGSESNEFGVSGPFMLYAPHNTSAYTFANSAGITFNTGDADGYIYHMTADTAVAAAGSARVAAEDVDAIKFIMSSGNIESGEIVMYGIANGT